MPPGSAQISLKSQLQIADGSKHLGIADIAIIEIIRAASSEFGIACASSECSGEPAHPRSLVRTSVARSYKQ